PRDCPDRLDVGEIRASEDLILVRIGDRYAADPRMRERAAQECDVLHSGKTQIRYILAAAAQKAVVFLAQEPRADALLSQSYPTSSRSPGACAPKVGRPYSPRALSRYYDAKLSTTSIATTKDASCGNAPLRAARLSRPSATGRLPRPPRAGKKIDVHL